jgi:integrase
MRRTGRREGLLFGDGKRPFGAPALQRRADEAWTTAELSRATLHECRHLYASMSIAAGINAHALCKAMGHSSIKVTYDEYGHLFPGNEAEAATLLDNYVTAAFAG